MPSLAAAETAYYGRLDAAYQRQIDDYDERSTALGKCKTLEDLEDNGFEPEHLETRGGFDRYDAGIGDPLWVCRDCGAIGDPDDGCECWSNDLDE